MKHPFTNGKSGQLRLTLPGDSLLTLEWEV